MYFFKHFIYSPTMMVAQGSLDSIPSIYIGGVLLRVKVSCFVPGAFHWSKSRQPLCLPASRLNPIWHSQIYLSRPDDTNDKTERICS
jgi:hypothetical protein